MLNVTRTRSNINDFRRVAAIRQGAAARQFKQGDFNTALLNAEAADTLRQKADTVETDLEHILAWADSSTGTILDFNI